MAGKNTKGSNKKDNFAVIDIGSAEPVLDNSVTSYLTTWWDEAHEWYEPPASLDHLTKLLRANAHHESAIFCKRNTVMAGFPESAPKVLSRRAMGATTFDHLLYGNCYLRKIYDRVGRLARLDHLHARTMRRKKERDRYCQVLPEQTIDFAPGEIIHISNYAPESSIYGLPEYLGALSSLLLNEQGTLFRRKYYINGAHMGFILHTTGDMDDEAVEAVRKKVSETKGVGNFQSMYLHIPGNGRGPENASKVEVIPVGEFAKDDFTSIKNISQADIITAHRVPPQILSVMTDNKIPTTGDLDKIVNLYSKNTVRPIQLDLQDAINEHLPEGQRLEFEPYDLPGGDPPEGDA